MWKSRPVLKELTDKILIISCYLVDNILSLKSYDHTCNNRLAPTCYTINNVRVNDGFFVEMTFILNLILVVISYEIFMKLAEDRVRSSIYQICCMIVRSIVSLTNPLFKDSFRLLLLIKSKRAILYQDC